MRTLHQLTAEYGIASVAAQTGIPVRRLEDLRAGAHTIHVDHLLWLLETYADFDLAGTVSQIGGSRRVKGRVRL